MKYFYDTEFLEDGRTIELISIGIVAEDGREYYAVNADFRWRRIAGRRWWAPWQIKVRNQWLSDHVVPSLPRLHGDAILHYAGRGPLGRLDLLAPEMRRYARLAAQVRDFVLADDEPELWAYYGAYDHVALCQLFGPMISLPEGMPMWTNDLMQMWEGAGRPEKPAQDGGNAHNALDDARWNRRLFDVCSAAAR